MKTKLSIPLLLLTVFGFVFVCSSARSAAPEAQPVTNKDAQKRVAPDWQLQNLEGKTVKLSDFKGKVVLLNFWATWCPPCREEIPDLVALQKRYAPQGLVVIGVSVDRGGPASVQAFAKRMKINYPIVMGNQKTATAYGNFQVIPTTFFINRQGEITGERQGAADEVSLAAEIKPLLEQKPNL
ncbi:MAG: TlpA family protein disulfide reductase [Verrucomicrobiota bacterium]|nr:TlpA family protein disulfide reductase [Verrucomicrobiota bacterium]